MRVKERDERNGLGLQSKHELATNGEGGAVTKTQGSSTSPACTDLTVSKLEIVVLHLIYYSSP